MRSQGYKMKRDQFVALCWGMTGILISISSVRIGLVTHEVNPGAGLFPLLTGLALIVLSIIMFFRTSRVKKGKKEIPLIGPRRNNLLIVLALLFSYALALNRLGFVLTTLLFMILSLKGIEVQSWRATLTIAFLSTFIVYLIFSLWLGIEFPRGILGL